MTTKKQATRVQVRAGAGDEINSSKRAVHALAPQKRGSKVRTGKKRAAVQKHLLNAVRGGSKTAIILDLLKRPNGASINELTKATGWQAHSVRGLLSGTLRKKMGLAIASTRTAAGDRRYSLTH